MTLFEGLLMAHLLGDWIFQTEWQAVNKARNWRALLVHILIYHIIVAAVLYLGFRVAPGQIGIVILPLIVIHILLDRRGSVKWIMRTLRITVDRPPEGWLVIAVDQALHLLLLGVAAIYLTNV